MQGGEVQPDAADAVRPGGAAGAHQRPAGAGDGARRPAGAAWSATAARCSAFTVPGEGDRLSPAVAWADRFYCADEATGTVYSFDAAGQLVETIRGRADGPLELEVRENHLFINSPDSATARVVDDKHQVREVDKYANDVLGGDPPPVPPPPPPPKKPRVGKPSAPRSVTAAAGNAQARVSWRPAAAERRRDHPVRGAGRRPAPGGGRQPAGGGGQGPDQRRDVPVLGARGQRQGRRSRRAPATR